MGDKHCPQHIKEAVCIQTDKIYDSCKDKECLEHLRVFFTECGQHMIDRANNVRCKNVKLLWVYTDVEPVRFDKGYFTVDISFYFLVTVEAQVGLCHPEEIHGLAFFNKKCILFGSEGNARIFTSKFVPGDDDVQLWEKTNLPKAVVETVDPICLGAKLVDVCDCRDDDVMDIGNIPNSIAKVFDKGLVMGGDKKRVFVTIGIFVIVKLERNVQLLIPVYDFCIPDKECVCTQNDPCELFERIKFPFNEFFPLQKREWEEENGESRFGCKN